MAKERAIQALRQTAHRLEEQGNWAGALETYRQALELAQADPSLFSSAQEIKRAIQDVQRRYEQAQQETEPHGQPKDKAVPEKISQDIWRRIANLSFIEQLKVPSTGEEVKSEKVLERGKEYTVIAKGTYSYYKDLMGLLDERLIVADAKDALLINDAKLEPVASDHKRHEYAFLITGAENQVSFRVSETAKPIGCLASLVSLWVWAFVFFPIFLLACKSELLGILLGLGNLAFIGVVTWGYKKRFGLTKGSLLVEIREGRI